jgi:hypothetical protein
MTATIIVFSHCIDPSTLGRLDYASLSQQALMEMLIDGIENKEEICGSQEGSNDITEWERVEFNDIGEVLKIDWGGFHEHRLQGTINFQWIPSTVCELLLDHNYEGLTGSIDLTSLPLSMNKLDLWINNFTGTINLSHLPENMEELNASYNKLSGSLDLENLPTLFKELDVHGNNFTGTVNTSNLPIGLELLWLSENQLSGGIDLRNLSVGIEALYLDKNNFSGFTDFSILPESLTFLNVSNTQLSGDIYLKEDEVDVDDFFISLVTILQVKQISVNFRNL